MKKKHFDISDKKETYGYSYKGAHIAGTSLPERDRVEQARRVVSLFLAAKEADRMSIAELALNCHRSG